MCPRRQSLLSRLRPPNPQSYLLLPAFRKANFLAPLIRSPPIKLRSPLSKPTSLDHMSAPIADAALQDSNISKDTSVHTRKKSLLHAPNVLVALQEGTCCCVISKSYTTRPLRFPECELRDAPASMDPRRLPRLEFERTAIRPQQLPRRLHALELDHAQIQWDM